MEVLDCDFHQMRVNVDSEDGSWLVVGSDLEGDGTDMAANVKHFLVLE